MNRTIMFVAVVALLMFGFTLPQKPRAYSNAVNDFRDQRALWEKRFASQSAKDAYAQFLNEAASSSPAQTHTLAHIIGAILYDRLGLDGIAYCTSDFSYGCYHGLSGEAIEQRGVTGIQELEEACAKTSIGDCEHGIGHGLLSYFGDAKINDALAVCPKKNGTETGTCVEGVFMEYMLGSLRKGDGHLLLPLDVERPEAACHDINKEFLSSCYQELPAWWRSWSAYKGEDYSQQVAIMGRRCAAVRDAELHRSCVTGLAGEVAAIAGNEPRKISALCGTVPPADREACLTTTKRNAMSRFPGWQGAEGI